MKRPRISALVISAIVATGFIGLTPIAASAATALTNCTETSLRAAVAKGGTVQYSLNCDTVLTKVISIPSTLVVTIDANGHSVNLDGGAAVRLFTVNGVRLTIVGIG